MWYNPNNPDLTVSERVRRQLEVYETAIDLNWPINHVSRNLNNMKATLLQAKQENFEYF